MQLKKRQDRVGATSGPDVPTYADVQTTVADKPYGLSLALEMTWLRIALVSGLYIEIDRGLHTWVSGSSSERQDECGCIH